ncbi:MAG: class I SAM-dependent methyltransferase [Niabella sp.]
MFEFHKDLARYFTMNVSNSQEHIMPFINAVKPLQKGMHILDIGCGEGGVIKPMLDMGLTAVGVELNPDRIKDAENFLAGHVKEGRVQFVSKDIYTPDIESEWGGRKFDLIILKDVIEHIFDQEKLIAYLQHFLKEDGAIFFGFPPWQMPYGGHQQLLNNKYLSKIPYYHLLPMPVYKRIMKAAKEDVQNMTDIKETGISIERFEKIVKDTGYTILNKKHYLLNPIYRYKFGWRTKEQFSILAGIPWVRNFFTTCVYYLIGKKIS